MELFYTLSTSIQVEQVLSFNHELLILYYIAPAALFAIPHKMLLARSLVSYPLPSPSLSCFQNYFLSSLYSVCYLTIKCPLSLSPKTAFSQTSLLCSLVKKENSVSPSLAPWLLTIRGCPLHLYILPPSVLTYFHRTVLFWLQNFHV